MPVFETEALVLKTHSLSDADKIVVFLTREHGLVRGVAKGAKRLTSSFGSTLEPASLVKLSYFQKEQSDLASVRHVDLLKSFFGLVSSPVNLQRFSYMAELLGELVPQGEPNERTFRMTQVCLEALAGDPESIESVTMYFELWLLKLGGYLPNWTECSDCRRQIPIDEEVSLQVNYQVLCRNCQRAKGSWNLTAGEREVYALAQSVSPSVFIERAGDLAPSVKGVSKVLRRVLSGVLGRELDESKLFAAKYS